MTPSHMVKETSPQYLENEMNVALELQAKIVLTIDIIHFCLFGGSCAFW